MAAITEPASTAIEAFFRPSTRLQDGNWGDGPFVREDCTELELPPGLSPEDALLLSGGSNAWEDFCCFLRGKLLWMAPNVYLTSQTLSYGQGQIYSRHPKLYINVTDQD
jgi:hypothetical protein